MTITTLKPDALVGTEFDFTDIYPHMGLNESGAVLMGYSGSANWPLQGFFGMGYRLNGDNLNTTFLNGWNVSAPDAAGKQAAKDAAIAAWWNRIMPWFGCYPEATNTCTNVAIRILNTQCYVLETDTNAWRRVSNLNNFLQSATLWDLAGTFTSAGAAKAVYPSDNINIPGFALCPTPADWASASTLGDTTKYRMMHAPVVPAGRLTVDAQKIAGVFCTFESQLVSTNGAAFNATPKILVQCGADALIDEGSEGGGAGTSLYGAPYTPAIGGSRWSYANSDGTRRKHYFGTFLHPNSYQDVTSAFTVAGGKSKMTAAEFQANMPRIVYQNTL